MYLMAVKVDKDPIQNINFYKIIVTLKESKMWTLILTLRL